MSTNPLKLRTLVGAMRTLAVPVDRALDLIQLRTLVGAMRTQSKAPGGEVKERLDGGGFCSDPPVVLPTPACR